MSTNKHIGGAFQCANTENTPFHYLSGQAKTMNKIILTKFHKKDFTKCGQFFTISTHLKKASASRQKLKNTKANSTPQACFFIRNLRTPKENALSVLLSMVERKGQPLSVGYVPLYVVSDPFTLYRPTVRSLAESLLTLQRKPQKCFINSFY